MRDNSGCTFWCCYFRQEGFDLIGIAPVFCALECGQTGNHNGVGCCIRRRDTSGSERGNVQLVVSTQNQCCSEQRGSRRIVWHPPFLESADQIVLTFAAPHCDQCQQPQNTCSGVSHGTRLEIVCGY